MQVSVESIGEIGRRMTVAVPADEVEKQFASRVARLGKTIKLPGFRPGKVPKKMVEARFGGQVMQELAGELIETSYRDAIGDEGLVPVGGPSIEPKNLERGQDLEYVATFDVFPSINCPNIDAQKIERPVIEIADADVERTIENVRRQRVSYHEVERSAENGDRVVLDFEGRIDGEVFDGGTATDFPVVLGAGQVLPELDAGLVGANANEQRRIEQRFPDDYPKESLAGCDAVFEVTVKAVEESRLPDVDAEFAKAFGIEDGSTDALRADVRNNLQRELDERIRSYMREQVMTALRERNDFDLPAQMLKEEVQQIEASHSDRLRQQGLDPARIPLQPDAVEADAQRRVALGLIIREVVNQRSIRPDAERVRAKLEQMAVSYENPPAFVQWYYSDKARLAQIESLVLEEQVVESLLEGAEVIEKKETFSDFMDGAAATASTA
jgi:trigger factor